MANKLEETSATTREFTLEFLKTITDDFCEKHIIGRGGYGVVYKGALETGEEIALKKLHPVHGLDDTQFTNEFNNLMRAQHPNITRLVGYCYFKGHERIKFDNEFVFAHSEERVLCFEYLQGGSLDKYISDESGGLDWQTRFNIIRGVCEGLNYLHNGSKHPIYHLDLKPENILLDKNMVPKIGDFGLSKLFRSTRTHITTNIVGTRGYMPPEYIDRREITSKYDVYSLGAIILRIVAGDEGYYGSAYMSSQDFLENVHENWEKRLMETMALHTSSQIETCIRIALRSIEEDRNKRPTIAEIVSELDKVDTADSSPTRQVTNLRRRDVLKQGPNSERRGNISFSTTNRSPEPFGIFSCGVPSSSMDDEIHDEIHLDDGMSYNYNGSPIPPVALKALLKNPKLAHVGNATDEDVEAGHVSGLVFVSERDDGLETLYVALRFNAEGNAKVFSLADIFGAADFSGMRLEDSGCIGGGYSEGSWTVDPSLIYVSTKEPVQEYRSPWTVVYKTSLITGKTERLTPQGVFDLNPSVSPSGKKVAVASFQDKTWNYESGDLKTDIYVMNVDTEGCQGLGRKLVIKDGGWPSWGSDNIIFFHRRTKNTFPSGWVRTSWCVFRYNVSTNKSFRVTPKDLDAVTPAAISESKVAVATIRNKRQPLIPVKRYRHIEIFDTNALGSPSLQITQKMWPECDHYNPFVLDGGGRIGYHCFRSILGPDDCLKVHKLESSEKGVGLYRLSGMFPAISKDGSKLAFVDKFKAVWVSDSQGLRMVYEEMGPDYVFYTAWNQNPDKDILYVGIGPSFGGEGNWPVLEIYSICNVSSPVQTVRKLTLGGFSNAFPSTNPDGNKLVFTSTRLSETTDNQWSMSNYCNLWIMLNTDLGESEGGWVTRLTKGSFTDNQCQWSPNGDWIVFSSSRDAPTPTSRLGKGGLPPSTHYSVYLVKADDPTVLIRVMDGAGYGAVFSPDGRSIAMISANLMPVVWEYVPAEYVNIFVVDIDPYDLKKKNKDVIKGFRRITHSKYGGWTLAWTSGLGTDTYARWNDMRAKIEEQHRKREKLRTMGEAATSSSDGELYD